MTEPVAGTPEAEAAAKAAEAAKATSDKAVADKAEADKGSKDQKAERVVPEAYELKPPEGSTLKPDHIEDVKAFAKANGLTNNEAQAILERDNALIASIDEGQKKGLEAERKTWVDRAMKDKEFGGEAFKKNVELNKRFVQKYAPEGLIKDLEATGLGDHDGLNIFLHRVIKAAGFSEDTFERGSNDVTRTKSPEEVLFPSMFQGKQ